MEGKKESSDLAIDIETVGLNWKDLDDEVKKYLLGRAKNEEAREKVPERLALNPGTGRIVAIGMWRPKEDEGGVLVEDKASSSSGWDNFADGASIYKGTEEDILKEFWRFLSKSARRLITYNGRSFDGPFLMLRSAILGIQPTRNFVPYRYNFNRHCDLAEVVSFYGARGLESLDFWCRQTGIESPKGEMEGAGVKDEYEQGNMEKIANYCLGDAEATAKLYNVLEPIIRMMDN